MLGVGEQVLRIGQVGGVGLQVLVTFPYIERNLQLRALRFGFQRLGLCLSPLNSVVGREAFEQRDPHLDADCASVTPANRRGSQSLLLLLLRRIVPRQAANKRNGRSPLGSRRIDLSAG